jgi:hypothetical protein
MVSAKVFQTVFPMVLEHSGDTVWDTLCETKGVSNGVAKGRNTMGNTICNTICFDAMPCRTGTWGKTVLQKASYTRVRARAGARAGGCGGVRRGSVGV